MRVILFLLLGLCVTASACRRRKAEPTLELETASPPPAVEPTTPATSAAAASVKAAPPVSVEELEAGPEFADLNNLVEYFYDRNKRVPTLQELAKMNGGPLPNPPGYKLVIDPKSKTVKTVR